MPGGDVCEEVISDINQVEGLNECLLKCINQNTKSIRNINPTVLIFYLGTLLSLTEVPTLNITLSKFR